MVNAKQMAKSTIATTTKHVMKSDAQWDHMSFNVAKILAIKINIVLLINKLIYLHLFAN